mgnify:FL=1
MSKSSISFLQNHGLIEIEGRLMFKLSGDETLFNQLVDNGELWLAESAEDSELYLNTDIGPVTVPLESYVVVYIDKFGRRYLSVAQFTPPIMKGDDKHELQDEKDVEERT